MLNDGKMLLMSAASFDLVVSSHSLDRDRNILPGTTEMAFWLAWKKDHYL